MPGHDIKGDIGAANSVRTTKTRGRPFQKGQSGNPKGRPKIPQEVKTMLKAATPQAAQLLIDVICNPKEEIKIRVDAAKTILDRVYGKATQPIDGDLAGSIKIILGEELSEYAE